MKRGLREFKEQCKSIFRAVGNYCSETKYFIANKRQYLSNEKSESYPSLLLRKRAHHLERYLFMPERYSEKFGKDMADEMRAVLDEEDTPINTQIKKWAKKILGEYDRSPEMRNKPLCVLMQKFITRRPDSEISLNELRRLLRQRRSRRIFEKEKLTNEEKEIICEAIQFAPSSCNRQTLTAIFVEEEDLKKKVSASTPGGYQFFHDAPAIMVLISEAGDYRFPDDRMVPFMDAAAAIENVYLLCEVMGLGCCWGSYASFGSMRKEEEIRKELNIPKTHMIVSALAIGRSKQMVCHIPRENPNIRWWNNRYESKD